MYKKHSLILLSTDEKSNIWLRNGKLEYNCSPSSRINPQHLYILSDDEIKEGDWYIFENKIIGHYLPKIVGGHCLLHCKKIIATTNTSLKIIIPRHNDFDSEVELNQISFLFIQHYIEQYNLGNVITEVEVEYEEEKSATYHKDWEMISSNGDVIWNRLKINPDNTINIKPLKDSWTRKEQIDVIEKYLLEKEPDIYSKTSRTSIKEWVENNL